MPAPFARTASQTRPTFSRDFAGLKTLDHGAGPSITFTRASNATFFDANGVLQTASNDQPRFDHDPATGASRGLLIEEARTNLLVRSAEFDNAAFTSAGTLTISANDAVSPDGTTTADKLNITTLNVANEAGRTQIFTSSSTQYSVSFFVKPDTITGVRIGLYDGVNFATRDFTFSSKTFGNVRGSLAVSSTSFQELPNGWYRVTATVTATSSSSAATASILSTSTGSGWFWGLQLEQGAFPTSYIPTTTAAATRSADSAVVTPISSFYNQSEGTLFAEGSVSADIGALVSVDDTTAVERIQIRRSVTDNRLNLVVADNNVSQTSMASSNGDWSTSSAIRRVAFAVKTDDLAASMNGANVITDTSATLPTVTRMLIGFGQNSNYAGGHIRKIAYYPRRLSNTLLQQLTT